MCGMEEMVGWSGFYDGLVLYMWLGLLSQVKFNGKRNVFLHPDHLNKKTEIHQCLAFATKVY